jgi:hypothetical protein
MKTVKKAITIPEDLFEQAEKAAAQMSMNRSQLYCAAIREYLEARDRDSVTRRLNQIYRARGLDVDPVVGHMLGDSLAAEPEVDGGDETGDES